MKTLTLALLLFFQQKPIEVIYPSEIIIDVPEDLFEDTDSFSGMDLTLTPADK